jgi:hypothetical protein
MLLLIILTLVVFALTLFRWEQVLTKLVGIARRGKWRWALRSAFANPLVISYFGFSVFMLLLYALTDNSFFSQGRNYFPYILSSFFITAQYAPRALTSRTIQKAVSFLLLLGLLLYAAIGGYHAVKTIDARYYGAAFKTSRP